MDFFTGRKFSNLMIFTLIIINIILLASFLYKNTSINKEKPNKNNLNEDLNRRNIRPHLKVRPRLRNFLKEKFNFTNDQINKFQKLRDDHFKNAGKLRSEIEDLRKRMMELLLEKKTDNNLAKKISLQIGSKIAKHENLVFTHFQDLINISGEKQLQEYRYFILGMFDRGQNKRNKPRDNGRPPNEGNNFQRPPQVRRDRTQPNNQNFNIENRINNLSRRLNLSENQIIKLRRILEEGLKTNHKIPSREHHEKMQKQNREIKKILTADQKELFKKLRYNRRQNQKN